MGPISIVNDIFEEWALNGSKSPLWFARNGFTFITQFAGLASVLGIFAGMCESTIRQGVKANYFILSHVEPVRPPLEHHEQDEWDSFVPRVNIGSKVALALTPFSSQPSKSAEDVAYKTLPFGGKKLARCAKTAMETGDITDAIPHPVMPPRFVK